jgi:hypothetical protein
VVVLCLLIQIILGDVVTIVVFLMNCVLEFVEVFINCFTVVVDGFLIVRILFLVVWSLVNFRSQICTLLIHGIIPINFGVLPTCINTRMKPSILSIITRTYRTNIGNNAVRNFSAIAGPQSAMLRGNKQTIEMIPLF